MSKKTINQTVSSSLAAHVEKAIILVKTALPQITPTFEEDKIKQQRKWLLQAIRGMQVFRRSAKTGEPTEKLQLLQKENYLDLVIHSLSFELDTSRDLLERLHCIAIEVLMIHMLDYPLIDHAIASHEKIFENLKQLFKSSIINKNFNLVQKISSMLYDLSFAQFNARILMFDPNVVFIVQNVITLGLKQFENQEFLLMQSYDYIVGMLQRLAYYEGFPSQLQYLYGAALINMILSNDLLDDFLERVVDLVVSLYQSIEIFYQQREELQSIVQYLEPKESQILQELRGYAQQLIDSLIVQ